MSFCRRSLISHNFCSRSVAAILSVTAKIFVDHFPSLLFYGIKKSPQGLMNFTSFFHDIIIYGLSVFLHLVKISSRWNAKISVYLFKDSFRIYFYISRSKHVEFFFHSYKIFPDQFFGYYTIRMCIHWQTVSGMPPWFLQMRKLL